MSGDEDAILLYPIFTHFLTEEMEINTSKKVTRYNSGFQTVGKTGFEPATPWSQTRCATGLRYFPNFFPAVRAGFEPAVQFDPYGSLANC